MNYELELQFNTVFKAQAVVPDEGTGGAGRCELCGGGREWGFPGNYEAC